MGNLANYESSEIGKQRMDTLRGHGAKADEIVRMMYALAVEYDNYRKSLDPVEDAEDIQYSDESLTYMVQQLKPILDDLSADQKQWLDLVLSQLGFAAV